MYYDNLGIVGENTWHVPFVLGATAAAAAMYFWPQKQANFAGLGGSSTRRVCRKYTYRNGKKRCAKFGRTSR